MGEPELVLVCEIPGAPGSGLVAKGYRMGSPEEGYYPVIEIEHNGIFVQAYGYLDCPVSDQDCEAIINEEIRGIV